MKEPPVRLFGASYSRIGERETGRIQMTGENHGQHRQSSEALHGCSAEMARYKAAIRAAAESAAEVARAVAGGAAEGSSIELGETIGWRCWRITNDGLLKSMVADAVWIPSVPMVIEDEQRREWFGEFGGVHAFKTYKQAFDYYTCYAVSSAIVFGQVALWGDVVEHEGGYRGEYGYPVSFERCLVHGDLFCVRFSLKAFRGRKMRDKLREMYLSSEAKP